MKKKTNAKDSLLTVEELAFIAKTSDRFVVSGKKLKGARALLENRLISIARNVIFAIETTRDSAAYYRRESSVPPRLKLSHRLGAATQDNVYLFLGLFAMLSIKSEAFSEFFDDFILVLDIIGIYSSLLYRIMPTSSTFKIGEELGAYREQLVSIHEKGVNDDALLGMVESGDRLMGAVLKSATEFYVREREIEKFREVKEIFDAGNPSVSLAENSLDLIEQIVSNVTRKAVKKLAPGDGQLRKASTEGRQKQVNAVVAELRARIKAGKSIDGRGVLRSVCRTVFNRVKVSAAENGYASFEGLYNYCQTTVVPQVFGSV